MKAPSTIPATIADLRETADRLRAKAIEAVSERPVDVLLFSKAAGYLAGMANWMAEETAKPAAAEDAENLTIADM